MENKKYLPIKIAHAVLMLAAMVMLVLVLVKSDFNTSVFGPSIFPIFCTITSIVALIVGFIYLFKGYKKNANVYYKLFMGLCVLYEVLRTVYWAQFTFAVSYLDAFTYIIATIMIVILAVGKDLGKRNTYIVYGIVLICRITSLIVALNYLRGSSGVGIISQVITNLLLAGTIGFMVTGKYLDKDARGTK